MIYYLIYAFLGLLCIVNLQVKKHHQAILLYIGALVVLLFQALRWRTGTDWTPYYLEFLNVNRPGHSDEFEFGYRFLNSFIRNLTDNYTVFLFVECGLNLLFVILFLKSMPINNRLLGLLYLFSIAVFPIRFTLASNIVLYSYKYIIKREFLIFSLLILLAFYIHRTTIIFLPMYFICRNQYSFKTIILVYFGCIILGVMTEYTFGHISKYASLVYGNMDTTIQGKMDAYITKEIPKYAKMTFLRYIFSIINSTLFILLFYYYKRTKFRNNQIYNVLFNMYVIGISFNRIFVQLIPDIARLTSLFSGGFIIMLIMILSKYNRTTQLMGTIGLILYIFISYYGVINGVYQDLFQPYFSIFSFAKRINVY